MNDEHDEHAPAEVEPGAQDEVADESARARSIILARRSRFVAAALAGVGLGGACASTTRPADDAGRNAMDASAADARTDEPHVIDVGKDAGPQVCLTPVE